MISAANEHVGERSPETEGCDFPFPAKGSWVAAPCPPHAWPCGRKALGTAPVMVTPSARVPQGRALRGVRTCPSALCLPLQALRLYQEAGERRRLHRPVRPPPLPGPLRRGGLCGVCGTHLHSAGGAVKGQSRAGVANCFPLGLLQGLNPSSSNPLSSTSAPGASLHPALGCCWGPPQPRQWVEMEGDEQCQGPPDASH